MSRQTFRLNLTSAEFPFLSGIYGRSIVYPQQDMHYIRPNAFTGTEADKNIGIPQMIFCENVMPASYGLQSVDYVLAVQPTAVSDFDQGLYLRDAAENRTLFVPGILGTTCKRYTYDAGTNIWSSSSKTVPAGGRCTVASLKSRTFVHVEFDDEFWEWTGAWANVTLTGLTAANIKGLVAANAYLIAYDHNTIYWSSTLDPVDFVPSLITGAGSQRILANKGRIVICYPTDDGFVIYTTTNTIVARYSNNTRFPWVYKEVKNSAGIADLEHATPQGDGGNLYVYTTNGMMLYGPTKAEQAFPTLNEFLGCRQLEQYNAITKAIDLIVLDTNPLVKIEFVANRWLVISYGKTSLTHALIFDAALKRWGKLRIDHVDCFEFFGNAGTAGSVASLKWSQLAGTWAQQNNTWFEYGYIISGGSASLTVPYRSLAFLKADGSVRVVNFDNNAVNDASVLLVGKIQFLRDRLWTISEVEAEGMGTEAWTKMSIWSSRDGLNFNSKIYPYKAKDSSGKFQHWQAMVTAKNHSLMFEGNFNLYTVVARGLAAGKR